MSVVASVHHSISDSKLPGERVAPGRRARITRAERKDIVRVASQRPKVAKAVAKQRTAGLKANFEAEFKFDQPSVWKAAVEVAPLCAVPR